jgi:hypothetical protein
MGPLVVADSSISTEMTSAAEGAAIYLQCFSCGSALKTDFYEREFQWKCQVCEMEGKDKVGG